MAVEVQNPKNEFTCAGMNFKMINFQSPTSIRTHSPEYVHKTDNGMKTKRKIDGNNRRTRTDFKSVGTDLRRR